MGLIVLVYAYISGASYWTRVLTRLYTFRGRVLIGNTMMDVEVKTFLSAERAKREIGGGGGGRESVWEKLYSRGGGGILKFSWGKLFLLAQRLELIIDLICILNMPHMHNWTYTFYFVFLGSATRAQFPSPFLQKRNLQLSASCHCLYQSWEIFPLRPASWKSCARHWIV